MQKIIFAAFFVFLLIGCSKPVDFCKDTEDCKLIESEGFKCVNQKQEQAVVQTYEAWCVCTENTCVVDQ